MYVYHIHVFSCIGNILLSHPYFQHLFSPKNSTCPITNTSLLLQKEPQRLLRADSLGSFVVFGTDSMGASASLKAAKLCLGKDGGKPNNQAGERQIFFVPIKFWWGPCLASIFFLIMGMPWSLNGMDQYGCHGRIRSLHKIHKHSINYQLFFHPRCTSSTDSLTFTAQQRDLGPDRPAPRQCRCTYLTSGALKPKPQTHGVNDDPKDFGDSGLENWLETNLAANLSRGLGANWTSMSGRMTLTLECPEICLEHQLLISMWKVGWQLTPVDCHEGKRMQLRMNCRKNRTAYHKAWHTASFLPWFLHQNHVGISDPKKPHPFPDQKLTPFGAQNQGDPNVFRAASRAQQVHHSLLPALVQQGYVGPPEN